VDDDATIILSYPAMEGVILASWNWPFNRKDMHVYGTKGYLFIDNAETIRYRTDEKSNESSLKVPPDKAPFNDPFTFFASVIKGGIKVSPLDLSSPEVNLTVVEILEAARKSSRSGKVIRLNRQP
jgi:predicted dehydrogenase